jgi:hypothetical protein
MRRPSRDIRVAVALASCLAGCSGSDSSSSTPPSDFSGTYSISVTNGDNGCNYANWVQGNSAQNISFDIAQSGSQASGTLKGLANFYFAVLGIGTLQGTVNGANASLTAVGTTSLRQGNCAYFVRATANIQLTGNALNGTMTYSDQVNGSPDCGPLTTCESHQSVSGSRPPK